MPQVQNLEKNSIIRTTHESKDTIITRPKKGEFRLAGQVAAAASKNFGKIARQDSRGTDAFVD